uniref:ubiquitinyl hydrolase 1 n=1 Tax=Leptobrachium leishanense TaxID=445787 RepID=A0A8C5QPW5_9ANUR
MAFTLIVLHAYVFLLSPCSAWYSVTHSQQAIRQGFPFLFILFYFTKPCWIIMGLLGSEKRCKAVIKYIFLCFMNSVIQSLSNTRELRDYFQDHSFEAEINYNNPLGTSGRLAVSFAILLRALWKGTHHAFQPSKLKAIVASKASQFTGYAQHDAQEFMAFLLDGLHEDLNRIQNKPYTETVDSDGRPDEEVADEAWLRHKMRNDSFVVDLFQDQYKSKLVCPVCSKVSITFDPFLYLPVPLPQKQKVLTIYYFAKEPHKKPIKFLVSISKEQSSAADVLESISQSVRVKLENLKLVEVVKNCFHRIFMPSCSLGSEGKLKRCTRCYRVGYCNQNCQKSHWPDHKIACRPENIGYPFLISVPESRLTYSRLAQLLEGYARYSVNVFQPPFLPGRTSPDPPHTLISERQDSMGQSSCTFSGEASDTLLELGDDCSLALVWKNNERLKEFVLVESKELECKEDPGSASEAARARLFTLDQCLNLFTKPEVLSPKEAWYCPKCNQHREASKQLMLWRLPNILIIQLKHFSFRTFIWRDKINDMVDFPVRSLDLSKFCIGQKEDHQRPIYDLYAVINH